jgi:hypothetical protein
MVNVQLNVILESIFYIGEKGNQWYLLKLHEKQVNSNIELTPTEHVPLSCKKIFIRYNAAIKVGRFVYIYKRQPMNKVSSRGFTLSSTKEGGHAMM